MPRAIEILLSPCAEKSCADGFTTAGTDQVSQFRLVQLELEQRRSISYVEELKRLKEQNLAVQNEVWLCMTTHAECLNAALQQPLKSSVN